MEVKSKNDYPEISRTVSVPCRLGLHLRVSGRVVQTAQRFKSEIFVSLGNHRSEAKSILGLVTLCAAWGKSIELTARGEDAAQAIRALSNLFEAKEILCQEETAVDGPKP